MTRLVAQQLLGRVARLLGQVRGSATVARLLALWQSGGSGRGSERGRVGESSGVGGRKEGTKTLEQQPTHDSTRPKRPGTRWVVDSRRLRKQHTDTLPTTTPPYRTYVHSLPPRHSTDVSKSNGYAIPLDCILGQRNDRAASRVRWRSCPTAPGFAPNFPAALHVRVPQAREAPLFALG